MQTSSNPFLELLSQPLKDNIPDQCRDNGDNEVSAGEYIVNGEHQCLSMSVGVREFSHQKIGIEQKNDECHLDDGTKHRGKFSGAFFHERIISESAVHHRRRRRVSNDAPF